MFCQNCGKQYKSSKSSFCSACGFKRIKINNASHANNFKLIIGKTIAYFKTNRGKKVLKLGAIVAVAIIIGILIFSILSTPSLIGQWEVINIGVTGSPPPGFTQAEIQDEINYSLDTSTTEKHFNADGTFERITLDHDTGHIDRITGTWNVIGDRLIIRQAGWGTRDEIIDFRLTRRRLVLYEREMGMSITVTHRRK